MLDISASLIVSQLLRYPLLVILFGTLQQMLHDFLFLNAKPHPKMTSSTSCFKFLSTTINLAMALNT